MRRKKRNIYLSYNKKEHKRINKAVFYNVFSWLFGIFAAVFLGVILVLFVGIKTSVVGTSMEPSLYNGEEVLLNKIIYQFSSPKRGDVIAFYPNGNTNSHLYVKRIVGLPGETIQIRQGSVYINGEMHMMDTETKEAGIADEPIELGMDEYFVMGDNRNNSEDSRSANIGNVTTGMIEGKVWYHLTYEDTRMGKVE